MSVIDVKKITELNLADNSPPAILPDREINLFDLLSVLYAAKKQILAGVVAFALIGAAIAAMLPQKWSSQAVITPSETLQWQEMQQQLVRLQILGIDTQITRGSVFDLFIKKFQSRSLLEEYLATSPYILAQLKGAEVKPDELHRAVVGLADKMKSVSNQKSTGDADAPYLAWTLSFVAPTAQDAQAVLEGYIKYVSAAVEKETMQNIVNAIATKTLLEEGLLEQKRVQLENLRSANIQRLNYSLEIANAAGIKKPVYSSGMAVKDDPDYSVALGADGIQQKLAIEKSITDVAQLDADFKNQQYLLEQLRKISVQATEFDAFKYQLSPSLPVTKDNPGKFIVILLAAIIGGVITCAAIVFRQAMANSRAFSD